MDSRDFAIGILSTSAVILLVGLLIISSRPETALADGMTTSGGDYVLVVGGVSAADEEHLYLLDSPMERLITYRFDGGRQQIEIVQGVELGELRRTSAKPGQAPTSRKKPAGRGSRP